MIPGNTDKLYESDLAVFWFEESGILCARTKDVIRTLDKQKRTYELIKQISDNKKVCLLSDTSSSQKVDEEIREYMASEMPKIFTAMAVLSETTIGKVPAIIFLNMNGQPIPIKMFTEETEAREWLKQYL